MKSSNLYNTLLEGAMSDLDIDRQEGKLLCCMCHKPVDPDNYIEYKGEFFHPACAAFLDLDMDEKQNISSSKLYHKLTEELEGNYHCSWCGRKIDDITSAYIRDEDDPFTEIFCKDCYDKANTEEGPSLPELNEKCIKENFGDTTDYTDEIEKWIKRWWKENADLGIRLFKGFIDVEARYTNDEFEKPIAYRATMNAHFVETEEYAEEIGKYVAEHIPSIEYVKFTYNEDKDSDEYEDVNIYFKQNQDIPDFGKDFEQQMLGEGYSLGDDEDSFDIWDKNQVKLYTIAGYLLKNGIEVVRDLDTVDKGVSMKISKDSIYKLVMTLKGYDGNIIGGHLHADGRGDDYIVMDIDDALERRESILDELKDSDSED